MAMQVNLKSVTSLNTSQAANDKSTHVSAGQNYRRLHPDVRALYDQYPCIPYISEFLSYGNKNIEFCTPEALSTLARISACIKKCLSGIEFEFTSGVTIYQELFFAQLRTLTFLFEEACIYTAAHPNYNSIYGDGLLVSVTHEAQEILDTVEKWPLFENLLYSSSYTPLYNFNTILLNLLINCNFTRKENASI